MRPRFDVRMLSHNFDFDWRAHAEVQKELSLPVKLGHLSERKTLALQLIKAEGYQVECSDEGLMTDGIRKCLCPVIGAVMAAGGIGAVQRPRAMRKADRVGCICDQELAELQDQS